MEPETFSTQSMRRQDQSEAWREWFGSVFDIIHCHSETGFPAVNRIWKLDGLVLSRVSAPAVRVQRTPAHVRRNPVDHWVLSLLSARRDLDQHGQGHVAWSPGRALFMVAGRGIRNHSHGYGPASAFSVARRVPGCRAGAGRGAERSSGYTARTPARRFHAVYGESVARPGDRRYAAPYCGFTAR